MIVPRREIKFSTAMIDPTTKDDVSRDLFFSVLSDDVNRWIF